MLRRLRALLWSRKEMILANKVVVTNLFMPLLMTSLYQFMFKGREGANLLVLLMVLPLTASLVGYTLPTLVSEEAEKNNQASLRLAGVKNWEYLVASLFMPFVLSCLYLFLLPLYLKLDWSELGLLYFPVTILTTVVIFLLFTTVALLMDSQSRASIAAMPIMLLTAFLPVFGNLDKNLEKFVSFSYMGAFADYQQDLSHYSLTNGSFLTLLVWLGLALLGLAWVMRRKQVSA